MFPDARYLKHYYYFYSKEFNQRWKSARGQYTRYKVSLKGKCGSAAKNKKKYIFADLLSFLDPIQDLEAVHESITSPDAATCDQSQNESTLQENVRDNVPLPRKRKRNKDEDNMSLFEKELVGMWKKTNEISFDKDIAFFNSIVPTVRSLNFENKLLFRGKVLKLLVQLKQNQASDPALFPVPTQTDLDVPSTSSRKRTIHEVKKGAKKFKGSRRSSTSSSSSGSDSD